VPRSHLASLRNALPTFRWVAGIRDYLTSIRSEPRLRTGIRDAILRRSTNNPSNFIVTHCMMLRHRAFSIVTSILLLLQPGIVVASESVCAQSDSGMDASMPNMVHATQSVPPRGMEAGISSSVRGDETQYGGCDESKGMVCIGMGTCTSPSTICPTPDAAPLHRIVRSFATSLVSKPLSHNSSPAVPPPRA
jgi:hypothetical protein